MLALQERAADAAAVAATTVNLGAVAQMQDDHQRALKFFERALAGFRATGNRRGEAFALRALALSFDAVGQFDRAMNAARESVALYEELGEQSRLADALQTLGHTLVSVGDIAGAFEAFARAFDSLRHAPHRLFTALTLLGYAAASQRADNQLEAVRAAAKGMSLCENAKVTLSDHYVPVVERLLERAKAALGEAQFDAAWMAGRETPTSVFADRARAS